MNKKELSERDICTKFITPALRRAGWDEQTQLREEVSFTKGRIISELQQQSGQANVYGTKLNKMLIPNPPRAEQHRIIANVNELMVVCDGLEAQIAAGEAVSSQLLDALLHEALGESAIAAAQVQ